jgi:hypothetical protein
MRLSLGASVCTTYTPPTHLPLCLSSLWLHSQVEGDEAVLSTQEKLRRAEEALKVRCM